MPFIDSIKEKARMDKKTIVLPETNDKRTLIAAAHIIQEGIADIILVGKREKILDGAGWLELDLDCATIVDPDDFEKFDEYVNTLYELRKSKGMTLEKAQEILKTDLLTQQYIVTNVRVAVAPIISDTTICPKKFFLTCMIKQKRGGFITSSFLFNTLIFIIYY